MTQNQERYEDRLNGPKKSISFASRTSPTTSMPAPTPEDEVVAELDEPPERKLGIQTDFHRSDVQANKDSKCKESLLTKALLSSPDCDTFRPGLQLDTTDGRRRSLNSSASTISSMELTSDGGLTSPHTNTPSPPIPAPIAQGMNLWNTGSKANSHVSRPSTSQESQTIKPLAQPVTTPKVEPTLETLTKKRCITFACGAQKPQQQDSLEPALPNKPVDEKIAPAVSGDNVVPQRRACSIKFACPAAPKQGTRATNPTKASEPSVSRSPTIVRKSRSSQSPHPSRQSSPTLSRRPAQSPVATRRKRPAFLTVTGSSEALRFHEFASDDVEEEDWIRSDSSETKKKITINDILKKENAIRQIGKEAEEEALQEEEEEDEEEEEEEDDDENEDDDDEEETLENTDDEAENEESDDGEALDYSDGNETDNEAGFAESDDESDSEEYQFWTLGRSIPLSSTTSASIQRTPVQRTTSESSIESPRSLNLPVPWLDAGRRKHKSPKRPKIRPGTPDLPDSTDFVCGTLDEDRPLEDAYISCMEVRKRERRLAIPQDIDPSFPTSEPDNEDEDDDEDFPQHDSDEPVFIHGKFEESDHDQPFRRPRSRKSPVPSPKRMHSPPPKSRMHSPPPKPRMHSPPPKPRMRSPPPKRHFGGASPRRMRSPHVEREMESITGSSASHSTRGAITFAPLGPRPGLTHTKSLPRTPNAFCNQYRTARLAAANENFIDEETTDGYTRGAIDIVKGLERKRQHRKEKLLRKQANRARKGVPERKPQPGKGAERMRELGLQMAGKGVTVKAEYVLSI